MYFVRGAENNTSERKYFLAPSNVVMGKTLFRDFRDSGVRFELVMTQCIGGHASIAPRKLAC